MLVDWHNGANFSSTTTPIPDGVIPSTTTPIPGAIIPLTTTLIPGAAIPLTTTPIPMPPECKTATNFTELERIDHEGSNVNVSAYTGHNYLGFACDFHKDVEWFQFTGEAGSWMLNVCPPTGSCGTDISY